MDNPVCGICGHAGVKDMLMCCTLCKIYEHQYCRYPKFSGDIATWVCEHCSPPAPTVYYATGQRKVRGMLTRRTGRLQSSGPLKKNATELINDICRDMKAVIKLT